MQASSLSTHGVPKNVLVWYPEARHCSSLIRELSDEYRLFIASDLQEAEVLADRNPIDLALLDVDLPRRSSLALLKRLHLRRPKAKVIMMTDYGDEELWVDLVNQGACDLLCHPIHRCDVERAI